MRAHVADLGISDESVADVIKLRCKDGKQSSFCISVCSKDAEKTLFSPNNWPEGVWIRTFRPARTKRYNPLPVKQRPPRLRKGNGQSTNTSNVYQNEHSNKTRSRFHTRQSAVEYQKNTLDNQPNYMNYDNRYIWPTIEESNCDWYQNSHRPSRNYNGSDAYYSDNNYYNEDIVSYGYSYC